MMNLYKVTCYDLDGRHKVELFVANSEKQAETYGREKHEDDYYEYHAEIVDNVDGYTIIVG